MAETEGSYSSKQDGPVKGTIEKTKEGNRDGTLLKWHLIYVEQIVI